MKLTSSESQQLIHGLIAAFPNRSRMGIILAAPSVERLMARIVTGGTLDADYFQIVQAANDEGWIDRLLDGIPHSYPVRIVAAALAIAVPVLAIIWVLAIPQRAGLMIFPQQMVALMLGLSLAVCFLRGTGWVDIALAAASLGLAAHVFLRFPVLSERAWMHPTEAMILGVVVMVLLMEGLRRVIGIMLIIIFATIVLYAVAGQHVPGALQGRPQPLADVLK